MPQTSKAKTTAKRKTTSAKSNSNAKYLVIVESPAKAKTIKKYLGEGYEVVASMGHVRDLPKSKLGVDVEKDFAAQYINIRGKDALIKSLKAQATSCEKVFLATDPDREGEAISWHLAYILDLDLNEQNRVTFNEITKFGVQSGMENPRTIDTNLVNAQQSRRVLDRIVGYKISPFLWKKIRKRGLSAGRVQSVVVRLIVDREEEIKSFVPTEYWSIDAKFNTDTHKKIFPAKLYGKDGKKITSIDCQADADKIVNDLDGAQYIVGTVKKGVRQKSPAPPFTTSTLQQEASRKLGFQSKRTMKAAQELYDGVDIPKMGGAIGLITYMRTDSLRISNEARNNAYTYIEQAYGKNYIPEKPRYYKQKSNSQDAHEAIRPTMPQLTPASVKENLTSDQFKLYKLIWERFISSQMANAVLDTVSADINAKNYLFKTSGYSVKFDGFTALYEEGKDEQDEQNTALPPLKEGQQLNLKELLANQHFTQPPARFTEASLIKTLEENGIGRPSTYAPTITTIISRAYVEREVKQLKPTALGEITTMLMKEHFSDIVDVAFTADMERSLDKVESGEIDWVKNLHEFYTPFEKTLKDAEVALDGVKLSVPDVETDVVCELCGRKMVIKDGKFGKFLACPGFPECKNTKNLVKESGGVCPVCSGKILIKKSKTGKKYFGCENNPKCSFMTWDEPLKATCPDCGSTLFKKTGRKGKTYCAKEGCGYVKP